MTVLPDTGSFKFPDASLVTSADDIEIAFEVDFGQSLITLFNVADEYLSAGFVNVVLLLNVTETGRGTLLKRPWGLSEAEITEQRMHRILVASVIDYHKSQGIAIVGKLSIELYI